MRSVVSVPQLAGLVIIFWVFAPVTVVLREWGHSEPWLSVARFLMVALVLVVLARCEKHLPWRGPRPLWPGLRAVWNSTPLLWTLLGLFFLSLLWSPRVLTTGFYLCGTGLMVGIGWYIHRRLGITDFVRLLAWFTGLLLLASWVVVLVDPEVGVHVRRRVGLNGAWRGVINHRNQLAMVAVFSALSLGSLSLWGRGKTAVLGGVGAALSVAMLWPAGSVGGLGLLLAAGVILALGRYTDERPKLRVPALILFVLIPLVVFLAREPLLELVGRDLTLSKRTIIWAHIIELVERSPLLGYGYGLNWPQVPVLQADLLTHGRPWQSAPHSGYLATAFWAGWPALALLVGFLVRLLLAATRLFAHGRPGLERVFPLALLALLVLQSFHESRMLMADFVTALLCALAFRLHAVPEGPSQHVSLDEAAK